MGQAKIRISRHRERTVVGCGRAFEAAPGPHLRATPPLRSVFRPPMLMPWRRSSPSQLTGPPAPRRMERLHRCLDRGGAALEWRQERPPLGTNIVPSPEIPRLNPSRMPPSSLSRKMRRRCQAPSSHPLEAAVVVSERRPKRFKIASDSLLFFFSCGICSLPPALKKKGVPRSSAGASELQNISLGKIKVLIPPLPRRPRTIWDLGIAPGRMFQKITQVSQGLRMGWDTPHRQLPRLLPPK